MYGEWRPVPVREDPSPWHLRRCVACDEPIGVMRRENLEAVGDAAASACGARLWAACHGRGFRFRVVRPTPHLSIIGLVEQHVLGLSDVRTCGRCYVAGDEDAGI